MPSVISIKSTASLCVGHQESSASIALASIAPKQLGMIRPLSTSWGSFGAIFFIREEKMKDLGGFSLFGGQKHLYRLILLL
jgi:hypothetical protein